MLLGRKTANKQTNKPIHVCPVGVRMTDPQEGQILSPRDLKSCTAQIQDLVLSTLNAAVAGKLLGSVNVLKDSYTGVLARCLESLEQSDRENSDSVRTTMALREVSVAQSCQRIVRARCAVSRDSSTARSFLVAFK